MKTEKGITLIALVITVIIMLILAGVALGQIAGEEGLFARANHVVKLYENTSQTEADRINEILSKADGDVLTKAEIEVNEDSITTKKATLIGKGEASGSGIAKYEFYVDGALYKTVETEESSTSIELTFTKDSHVCYVRVYNKEDKYLDSTEITVNKHVHTDECYKTETKTGTYSKHVEKREMGDDYKYDVCNLCNNHHKCWKRDNNSGLSTSYDCYLYKQHCTKQVKTLICRKRLVL